MCGHLCIPRRRHPSCFPTIRMSNMNSNSSISVELDIADIQIELEDLPKSSHSIGNGADASIPEYKRPDEQRIVSYVINSIQREDEFSFLQLEFLQRLNIVNHEVKLARMKSQVQHDEQASPTQLDELAIAMRDYSTISQAPFQHLHRHILTFSQPQPSETTNSSASTKSWTKPTLSTDNANSSIASCARVTTTTPTKTGTFSWRQQIPTLTSFESSYSEISPSSSLTRRQRRCDARTNTGKGGRRRSWPPGWTTCCGLPSALLAEPLWSYLCSSCRLTSRRPRA